MLFEQFRHEKGGCLSYVIGCTRVGVCVVVDPQIDIDRYVNYANLHRMGIAHIFETHAQADHLSGAKILSEVTGAPVHFHESAESKLPIVRVRDGQEICIGNIHLNILHTPGHTPESMSILVSDTER